MATQWRHTGLTWLVAATISGVSAAPFAVAQSDVAVEALPAPSGAGLVNPLVRAADGTLFGTTVSGGKKGLGTVFSITTDGRRTRLHDFSGPEGASPLEGQPLLVADDGNLYGVTRGGGPGWSPTRPGCGTVFRLTPSGAVTRVHAFDCDASPSSGLTQDGGDLYGLTTGGGLRACGSAGRSPCGTIYRLRLDGSFSTVHQFRAVDGWAPRGTLVRVGSDLYGVTRLGGNTGCLGLGCGTVFRRSIDGTVTTLVTFPEVLGEFPEPSDLVYQEADAALYGVMRSAIPCVPLQAERFGYSGCGAVFRLDMVGHIDTLFSFSGSADDGNWPSALAAGRDGHLYGVTQVGGVECLPGHRCGTVFRLTLQGSRTTLHAFEGGRLGIYPYTLLQAADGDLYGTMLECASLDAACDQAFRIALLDDGPLPNLRVKAFQAPSRAATGATITLRDTVANIGATASTPSSTTYAWSAYDSLPDATPLTSRSLPSLQAGATSTGETTAALPAQPGVYTLFAWADGEHLVRESLEFDNTKRRTIVVGPNLVIKKLGAVGGTGIELEPTAPTSSTPTTISVYTANTGGGTAGPSVTRLYRSQRGALSDAVLLAEFDIGSPDSLEHHHSSATLQLPAGDYFLLALADADGQVTEASEDNLFKLRVSVSLGLQSYLVPANGHVWSLAEGPDGAVWCTLSRCEDPGCTTLIRRDAIGRVATDGTITEFPLPSSNIAGGAGTYGLTTGPDNALWFTQIRGNRIGRMTTEGGLTMFRLPADSNPYLITSGPDGALWFTESGGIGRITTSGDLSHYRLPSAASNDPTDIVTGPDGALWFTAVNRNTIGRITTVGEITEHTMPPSCAPLRIAAGKNPALWFTCLTGNTVGRLTTDGVISTYRVPTRDGGPADITLGGDGALWFTETWARKIGRLTTDGVITEAPAGPGSSPHDIISASDGLWFTDAEYLGHIRLGAGHP
ncbi:hypothetical protein TBR22_A40050 [Luteitalea sp. TBR-22]|uniref:virginiamycin B lyase family protein n=1 Tax=Luteitalea sp. TBR-22 TaxID=2802971 RepID=UPI001AF0695C|nr:choice-of-anchor tandem repeat GloVer-containing protein [Luteitalea sp. TBR-22]BCS34779.1 hypothetical protein TBR22_A40050 [Luteitalea sp. TBR-22]